MIRCTAHTVLDAIIMPDYTSAVLLLVEILLLDVRVSQAMLNIAMNVYGSKISQQSRLPPFVPFPWGEFQFLQWGYSSLRQLFCSPTLGVQA